MPLLKRKAVLYHPLPSLSTILQPLASTSTAPGPSSSPIPLPPPSSSSGKGKKSGAALPPPSISGASDAEPSSSSSAPGPIPLPPDSTDDDSQLDRLLTLFRADVGEARKDAKGRVKENVRMVQGRRLYEALGVSSDLQAVSGGTKGKKANGSAAAQVNGNEDGGAVAQVQGSGDEQWRVWDRECFYVQETGEIFTDYESYCNRLQFLSLPLYQCEVSGKSAMSYYSALASEQREARLLHTRFPRQLKRAVLSAVQFQVEGKLDTLADKIYERFVNRFFDDEKVFIDVDGDKYLARIVRTFPPKAPGSTPRKPLSASAPLASPYHALATDLNQSNDDVIRKDDPMAYFYNVRLIEEGAQEGFGQDNPAPSAINGTEVEGEEKEEGDEKWEGSVMEVKADKISRDRINFSRAILKRFIRDCIHRDAAVYSPWLVKKSVAARYGISTEMSEEVKRGIAQFRERQMDKRKREREERLGIAQEDEVVIEERDSEKRAPKKKKGNAAGLSKKEQAEAEAEEARRAEEEKRRKRPFRVPTEDLLVEYSSEKDAPAGRIGLRPAPNKNLPFGEQFEQFLMTWSFLNVMGIPLKLSPFSLDDFESSLYHTDPSSAAPILAEIHACLLNVLSADLSAGNEAVRPLKYTGKTSSDEADSDTDYWEGKKGATTETLAPIAAPLALSWKTRELVSRDGRRGWQDSLVGCLWDRATLDTLPSYLDNILHMTYEDKPAPTRPTWSTGPPANSTGPQGLIPSKPDKRYPSIHFTHKLDIISFLIELVGQTGVVRDYLEESTVRLTEVRKEQMDVKRDYKRIQLEKAELEPKEVKAEDADAEPTNGIVNGDLSVTVSIKGEAASRSPSLIGRRNGHLKDENEDELEDTPEPGANALGIARDDASDPAPSSPISELDTFGETDSNAPEHHAAAGTAAARRKAMAAAAAERSALEAERKSALTKQRAADKEKKGASRHIASEKRRLAEEEEAAEKRLHELEYEFRSALYTLRSRPLGADRFGNKVWWMDGLGSAPLVSEGGGKVQIGSGRIYVQGPDSTELGLIRQATGNALAIHWAGGPSFDAVKQAAVEKLKVEYEEEAQVPMEQVVERRTREEGEGMLGPGEWAVYDTPEQLAAYISYLNPRGIREIALIKSLKQWLPEIEGGMRRRRVAAGLDEVPEDEHKRVRMTRKAAGEEEGWMNWKNRRAV